VLSATHVCLVCNTGVSLELSHRTCVSCWRLVSLMLVLPAISCLLSLYCLLPLLSLYCLLPLFSLIFDWYWTRQTTTFFVLGCCEERRGIFEIQKSCEPKKNTRSFLDFAFENWTLVEQHLHVPVCFMWNRKRGHERVDTKGEVKIKRGHRGWGQNETSAQKERFRWNIGKEGEVTMKRRRRRRGQDETWAHRERSRWNVGYNCIHQLFAITIRNEHSQ